MKLNWIIGVFLMIMTPILTHAQDKTTKNDCWCKNERGDPKTGDFVIWNIDLISSAPGNPLYNNVEGCEGDGCDDEKCSFDIWICRFFWLTYEELTEEELERYGEDALEKDSVLVKRCGYEPGGKGECTDDDFENDLPWDTTGTPGPDCDCVFVDQRGSYTFYTNVDIKVDLEDENYAFLDGEDQCIFDCEGSTCYFWKYNGGTGDFDLKEGFCTAYWPSGGTLAPILSTEVEAKNSTIKFYPNPTNSTVFIEADENTTTEIYAMSGQLIATSTEPNIDVSQLANGVYYIVITQGDQLLKDKLIIQ